MRKHRVYKYSGFWYAECGQCPDVRTSKVWSATLSILEFHIREHRGDMSLTPTVPVGHP